MITVLLEQIIQLLKGWIESFNNHAEAVEESLTDLNNTASDIELNTDPIPEIRDNTGAIITPITQIKTNTDSIKTDVTQIKTDTGIIKNNANSIATSAGAAAAFAEDCATNTLDIKDKITTIASDTTQIRTDSDNMVTEQSKIYDAVKWLLSDKYIESTESGSSPFEFETDVADDLISCKVGLVATQSGSGDPSPNNVRTISGYSSMSLTVNESSITISLGDTYYGGYLDVISGSLIITYGFSDLGDLNWNASTTGYSQNNADFNIKPAESATSVANFICSSLLPDTPTRVYNRTDDNSIAVATNQRLRVYMSSLANTTAAQFKAGVTGIKIAYELLTPITVSLTAQQIAAIKGVNTITTDTNGNIEVTYKESIKNYLDKQ